MFYMEDGNWKAYPKVFRHTVDYYDSLLSESEAGLVDEA